MKTAMGVIACMMFSVGASAGAKFEGSSSCKVCHKAKTGDQWGKWEKEKHAQAFKTLGTDKARELGKAKGVADPQKDEKCLKCHVAGRIVAGAQFGAKFLAEEGVGCEGCHGPAEEYKKPKIMSTKAYKDDRAAAHKAALAAQMTMPTEATCKACHNAESPTFKEFNFTEAWGKIAHCNPNKGAGAVKTGNVCP